MKERGENESGKLVCEIFICSMGSMQISMKKVSKKEVLNIIKKEFKK